METQENNQLSLAQNKFMNEKETALMLGFSQRTLQNWRHSGQGPKYLRVNRRVIRYRLSDVQSWVDSRIRESTATENLRA